MTTKTVQDVTALGLAARNASRKLARLSTEDKNRVLLNLVELLRSDQAGVLAANAEDYQEAKADGLDESILDRLLLTSERLNGTADELQRVAELPDPIGEVIETTSLPNGLVTSRRRVPLGVVGSIYESRPNVTVDIFGLCLKSGNACILRGGKETIRSNTALVALLRKALTDAGVTTDAVQFLDNPDRALVDAMLKMNEYIDLLVPRGTNRSMYSFILSIASTSARSGLSRNWTASVVTPASVRAFLSRATSAVLERIVSLPPRRMQAFPDLRQRPNISTVTLGRDS